jgi:hypothetical protein
MLKRFAALLFILAIVGQASAAVCVCIGTQAKSDKHSCCKKKKQGVSAMSRKSCCETDCDKITQQNGPRNISESSVLKVSLKASSDAAHGMTWQLQRRVVDSPVLASPFINHRLKYSRPPDLFLRHKSFLI